MPAQKPTYIFITCNSKNITKLQLSSKCAYLALSKSSSFLYSPGRQKGVSLVVKYLCEVHYLFSSSKTLENVSAKNLSVHYWISTINYVFRTHPMTETMKAIWEFLFRIIKERSNIRKTKNKILYYIHLTVISHNAI